MPTGSSAITLVTTAKLEQESFDGEPCRMETWTVITKGQIILKKIPTKKLATLSTPPHRRCVHQDTALLAKRLLVSFFFLSEINGFLPIGLAFPAEGSADVAMLCFSEHHLCTTFACQQYQKHHWSKCSTQWHRERIILEFSITENFPQACLLKRKMCHQLFKGSFK